MENKIDEYYLTSKNNNEYTLYFIQRNDNEYELFFDLKYSEFNGVKYKKTNLFEPFEVLGSIYIEISSALYNYSDNSIFYVKIFNKVFKTIYDYIIERRCVFLFYNIEIKDDYMIFTRNDFTIL